VGTIDLPHVSRYGTNTINSTNSGKLLPQPNRVLEGLGPRGGLWSDPLLSHEQIELGPCCWVAPWTKVVGQSAEPHADDEATVNDRLMTYLMPFAIAGVGGELTRGLVMPGELSVGLGPKQRHGAWVFTYAPGAVIAMIARLHATLPEAEKPVADTIVDEALQTAVAMTRAMAAEYGVDLSLPLAGQPRGGWPCWIATTHALLRAHMDSRLWQFEDGQPREWHERNHRWLHPRLDTILPLAPDALEHQWRETDIFKWPCNAKDSLKRPRPVEYSISVEPLPLAVSGVEPELSLGAGQGDADSQVAPGAQIAAGATIAPGCRIGPSAIVEADARIWRAILDNCHIEAGAVIQRSVIRDSHIGAGSTVRSCRIVDSRIGANSTAEAASVERSTLAARATVSPLTWLRDVETDFGAILGARCRSARIRTNFMSMHLAGDMAHVEALPTQVLLDGRPVLVPAIPMIGGGAILRGTADAPIQIECSFIGSNAILEAGVRLGFGCFVLGRLPAGSGLPPLTVSTDENPERHQIGGVLASLPSTIITHFLGWAFQAVEPEMVPAVAELVRQSIQRGIEAVETELVRREGASPTRLDKGLDHGGASTPNTSKLDYASLVDYTNKQLETGLAHYRRSLASGAWDLVYQNGELRFAAQKGQWLERSGTALWKGPS
ncbi:MAG: hypothetical protein JW888_03125, partial [Pirellulales bacterium]|nr:hypothetical protein [Pirellulales bacterium]